MRTTLTRALVGLGLAGALFLGAGAAVAQTAGDSSSSSSTTTAQNTQSTQSPGQDGYGYTVFGKVVDGMSVVNAIAQSATGPGGPFPSTAAARRILTRSAPRPRSTSE